MTSGVELAEACIAEATQGENEGNRKGKNQNGHDWCQGQYIKWMFLLVSQKSQKTYTD